MKKILLSVILSVAVITLNAQVKKGSILLGGSVSVSNSETQQQTTPLLKTTNNVAVISPAFGYAFKDNSVAGINLSFGSGTSKQTYGTNPPLKDEIDLYGAGIFYRPYLNLSNRFYLFGEFEAGFQNLKREQDLGVSSKMNEKEFLVFLDLTPGIAFAVNKRFHLEASINNILSLDYETSERTYSNAPTNVQKTSGFNFHANAGGSVPLSLGIRLVLGK